MSGGLGDMTSSPEGTSVVCSLPWTHGQAREFTHSGCLGWVLAPGNTAMSKAFGARRLWICTRRRMTFDSPSYLVALCALVLFTVFVVYGPSEVGKHEDSVPLNHRYRKTLGKAEKTLQHNQEVQVTSRKSTTLPAKRNRSFADVGHFPAVALASFPCSGNTWTRYLVERASGYFTGSSYRDTGLEISGRPISTFQAPIGTYLGCMTQYFPPLLGFLGEKAKIQDGTVVVSKTHDHGKEMIEEFQSGILLVRNPYKAILSFHNFLFTGHLSHAPVRNFLRKDWPRFVEASGKKWLETYLNWLEMSPKVLVVHYENLTADPSSCLRKMLHFLDLSVDENRMACIQNHRREQFRRPSGYVPDVEFFPPEVRRKMDKAILHLDGELRKRGLHSIPLSKYEYFNGTKDSENRVQCTEGETEDECWDRIDAYNRIQVQFYSKYQQRGSLEEIQRLYKKRKKDSSRPPTLMDEVMKKAASALLPLLRGDPLETLISKDPDDSL
ncbi:unnamed protein product [Darwinula stevensoni]|uniref:Sulfotransferase domain-containing protein n=1 Tax=Darwinula stevensoni TaxID=69355 RepID=A0A7R9A6T2_9CRUS|nr:unnamed protein product [Darwinula stevensoni]CAG0888869.1 unnamed protein product [Darwinula stevensoni]